MVIFVTLFSQLTTADASEAELTYYTNNSHTAYINSSALNDLTRRENQINSAAQVLCTDPQSCLQNIEFNTIKLEKGRKFIVKSDQALSNEIYNGTQVKFESPQKESIFAKKSGSKVIFQGKVTKTSGPRKIGKSGVVKIELDKITIDKITYPVAAIISKIENKNVSGNNLMADSIYLSNLANVANTGTIHSSLKDPCKNNACIESGNLTRPVLFLTGAALGAADLLLSPFVSLFKTGKNVTIPQNTYFEIKLDKDLYVLNI